MLKAAAKAQAQAGDRVREVVEEAAKTAFNPRYRQYDSGRGVPMGTAQGTNNFSESELQRYCEDVITEVNRVLRIRVSWTRKAKTSWTYGETVNQIWADCFDQMTRAARAFSALVAP